MKRRITTLAMGSLAIGALVLTSCSADPAETPDSTENAETVKVVVLGGIGAQGTTAGTASTSDEFVFVQPGPMINGQFHPFEKQS